MLDQFFSWATLLTVVGLTGFYFAGKKKWWCWYINIGCQGLWFTYAIVTEQYAFILASLAYTWVFTNNAIKWTRERNQVPTPEVIGHVEEVIHDANGISVQFKLDDQLSPKAEESIRRIDRLTMTGASIFGGPEKKRRKRVRELWSRLGDRD